MEALHSPDGHNGLWIIRADHIILFVTHLLSHTHSSPNTLSPSLTHTVYFTHTLYISLTHTVSFTHTHTVSFTHTHCLLHSHTLSILLTSTVYFTHTVFFTHTHCLIHSHTLSPSLTHTNPFTCLNYIPPTPHTFTLSFTRRHPTSLTPILIHSVTHITLQHFKTLI